MKLISSLLFLIILVSCNQTIKTETKAKKEQEQSKTAKTIPLKEQKQSLKQTQKTFEKISPVEDTTFIVRNITEDSYHTIYIDQSKKTKSKNQQSQPRITKSLQQKITVQVAEFKNEEKLTDFKLPQFWVPLYQYKNEYYLYEPCDGIFEFEYLVTKNAVTNIFYDGPFISVISSSKRINNQHYYFEFHQ